MTTPVAARVSTVVSEFERRAARAEFLLRQAPGSEEPLRFAAGLYRVQGRIARVLESNLSEAPFSGRLDQDSERFAESSCATVLRYAAEEGPEALSAQARSRQDDLPATARTRLQVFWEAEARSQDYLSRAILRPYVEVLRSAAIVPDRVHRRGHCPFCGGPSWISARREGSLMEGARRMLGCCLCGGEWLFGRILCPSCFEEDPQKLPSFQNDKYPAIRIEACETCRRYVKSIDLSEDARPIPEVDDLVSLSVDLWAIEQGFTRIEGGLAGL